MKTRTQSAVLTLLFACAFTSLAPADDNLPYYGWKLTEIEGLLANRTPGEPFVIMLEGSEGFRPNINILIQDFPGPMNDYMELSRGEWNKEFENSWNVLSEKRDGEKEWTLELKGVSEGKGYRVYFRVVKEGSKVYLITAMALESQWASVGEKLRRNVNAFQKN